MFVNKMRRTIDFVGMMTIESVKNGAKLNETNNSDVAVSSEGYADIEFQVYFRTNYNTKTHTANSTCERMN